MKKTFNYWRELYKARLKAEELFRRLQIELLKEKLETPQDDLHDWMKELIGAMDCAERIGRKLDELDDEDSIEMEEEDIMADEEEEQTVFNPEIEYDFEQLGELVYDPYKNIYTNEKGQIFKERADGCFVLIKSEDNNND